MPFKARCNPVANDLSQVRAARRGIGPRRFLRLHGLTNRRKGPGSADSDGRWDTAPDRWKPHTIVPKAIAFRIRCS